MNSRAHSGPRCRDRRPRPVSTRRATASATPCAGTCPPDSNRRRARSFRCTIRSSSCACAFGITGSATDRSRCSGCSRWCLATRAGGVPVSSKRGLVRAEPRCWRAIARPVSSPAVSRSRASRCQASSRIRYGGDRAAFFGEFGSARNPRALRAARTRRRIWRGAGSSLHGTRAFRARSRPERGDRAAAGKRMIQVLSTDCIKNS